jgi:hypothetical protein
VSLEEPKHFILLNVLKEPYFWINITFVKMSIVLAVALLNTEKYISMLGEKPTWLNLEDLLPGILKGIFKISSNNTQFSSYLSVKYRP